MVSLGRLQCGGGLIAEARPKVKGRASTQANQSEEARQAPRGAPDRCPDRVPTSPLAFRHFTLSTAHRITLTLQNSISVSPHCPVNRSLPRGKWGRALAECMVSSRPITVLSIHPLCPDRRMRYGSGRDSTFAVPKTGAVPEIGLGEWRTTATLDVRRFSDFHCRATTTAPSRGQARPGATPPEGCRGST